MFFLEVLFKIEHSIAEGLGVVGSCSERLQQVLGSNPGGGGSRFGWILAAGKTNLRNSVLGVRVKHRNDITWYIIRGTLSGVQL